MQRASGFPDLLRAFHLALTVEGLRPATIENYVGDVRHFAAWLGERDPRDVTTADLRAFLAEYAQGRRAKTVRETQIALKRFFRFLAEEGEVRRDPAQALRLMSYRVDPQPTYTQDEVETLLAACGTRTLEGVRDRALVRVLFDTGVREGELLSMTLPDWERGRAWVTGKTGPREVPLGMAARQELERYLRRWRITETPLWRGKKGPLTESGVVQVVKRLCRKAGVPHKGVHAFRRAAAVQMKRDGMQDSDLLEVFGWKTVVMLRRYTAAVAAELAREAHRRYSPGDSLGRIGRR